MVLACVLKWTGRCGNRSLQMESTPGSATIRPSRSNSDRRAACSSAAPIRDCGTKALKQKYMRTPMPVAEGHGPAQFVPVQPGGSGPQVQTGSPQIHGIGPVEHGGFQFFQAPHGSKQFGNFHGPSITTTGHQVKLKARVLYLH